MDWTLRWSLYDIDAVRPGTILLAPVKVAGAGVYMGDMHALHGDGEIAGHTMDVSGDCYPTSAGVEGTRASRACTLSFT